MIGPYLYRQKLAEILRPGAFAVWGIVVLAVYGLSLGWVQLSRGIQGVDAYVQLTSMLAFRVLALASAVFATSVVSQEVEQKTIVYLLTRPISRARLLLWRAPAAMTAAFGVGAASVLACALATFGPSGLGQAMVWRDVLAVAGGAAAYGGLFVLFSLWLNRAMVYSLLFAFGWEVFLPNFEGKLYYLSIFTYLTSAADHPEPAENVRAMLQALSGQLGQGVSATTAWLALPLIAAGCMALGAWWFTRFEYVPREDSE